MITRRIARADLLRPSLSHGSQVMAPYSPQAGFVSAFFGGPAAALLMGALNANRLKRLPLDAAWLIAALAAFVGLEYWLSTQAGVDALEVLKDWVGVKPQHTVSTATGLLYFGLCSLMHGRQQRMATLMGLDRPKGLWVGLLAIVLGSLAGGVIRMAFA